MMQPPVAHLQPGDTITSNVGVVTFVRSNRHSITVATPFGVEEDIPFDELICRPVTDGKVAFSVRALEPLWSSLRPEVRAEALFWLAVVNEIECGFRAGHDRFAEPGEPLDVFADPTASLEAKCVRMEQLLRSEAEHDRERVRRFYNGEISRLSVKRQAIRNKVMRYRKKGLVGLIDERSIHAISFDKLDPRLIDLIDEVLAIFTGDVSTGSAREVYRRVLLLRKDRGLTDLKVPQRQTKELISERLKHLGRTPRAHKSSKKREHTSGYSSNYALHPAHLSIDMTVADVYVIDRAKGKLRRVEVIVVMSVSTRVIVALRVVPKAARAFEVGLAIYDSCRDMSAHLEVTEDGVTMDDFRSIYPLSLDISNVGVRRSDNVIIPPGNSLADVVLCKPGVRPVSIRHDNGSIFTGHEFPALMDAMGIHLMPSNVETPTNNGITERHHETLESAFVELLERGYVARNPVQRGRKVDADLDKLMTAAELERFLWRWIAIKHHRVAHDGLHLPGDPDTPVSPLAMWDALLDPTGLIAVPFHPDLITQFLPVLQLTVQHDGVEHQNRTYDDKVLDDFRQIRKGQFIRGSYKVPFHYDPRDPARLFFRHPDTDRIHSIWWRQHQHLQGPMTDWILQRARRTLRAQGGPSAIRSEAILRQIINEIGAIDRIKSPADATPTEYAARLRWEKAQQDHAEVADAQVSLDRANGILAFPDHEAAVDPDQKAALPEPAQPNGPAKSIPGRDWAAF